MIRRCARPTCIARTVVRTRIRLLRVRPEPAFEILGELICDVPEGSCMAGDIRQLERELIEHQGWTRAYHARERQRSLLATPAPAWRRKGYERAPAA